MESNTEVLIHVWCDCAMFKSSDYQTWGTEHILFFRSEKGEPIFARHNFYDLT